MAAEIEALTFTADGHRLGANGRIWDVIEYMGQTVLRPLPMDPHNWEVVEYKPNTTYDGGPPRPKGRVKYVAGHHQLWAAWWPEKAAGLQTKPATISIELTQLLPEKRQVRLAADRLQGDLGVTRLVLDPDGKRAVLEWVFDDPYSDGHGSVPGRQIEYWDLEAPNHVRLWALKTFADDTVLADYPYGRPESDIHSRSALTNSYLPRPLQATVDGESVVAFSPSLGLHLRDFLSGESRRKLTLPASPGDRDGYSSMQPLVFGPRDELMFCVPGNENRIFAIPLRDGGIRGPWVGHEGQVTALASNPDGQLLVSGGDDQTLRIWEVASGRELAYWNAHDAKVTALAFHPNGKTFCSGDADGVVKLWDLPQVRRELQAMGLDVSSTAWPSDNPGE
jgi:WD40 repeat protein